MELNTDLPHRFGRGAPHRAVELAAPDRTVITLVEDGLYIFGEATAAYWNATKQNMLRLYPDGAAACGESYQSKFHPSAELARVAEAASGALALAVSSREELLLQATTLRTRTNVFYMALLTVLTTSSGYS